MTGPNSLDLALEQGSNHMFFKLFSSARKRSVIFMAGLLSALTLSGIAQAQDVLVMNEERILRESTVGQHISTRIQEIGAEIELELQPLRTQLEADSNSFQSETASMTQEAIAARPDLLQRYQQLQGQVAQYEQIRQVRAQEILATERQAMAPVLQQLQGILQEIVTERNAAVLLDRSQVVYAGTSIDISQSAIERLNQRMTTTPVNRVRVSDQAANGQAAPQ